MDISSKKPSCRVIEWQSLIPLVARTVQRVARAAERGGGWTEAGKRRHGQRGGNIKGKKTVAKKGLGLGSTIEGDTAEGGIVCGKAV